MDWAIKIGYAVMVFAIIMCFIFSKRGEKEMRHMVDRFARRSASFPTMCCRAAKRPRPHLPPAKRTG